MLFSNRTAIVTGAAHGIGLAIAQRLQAEGVRLVLGDIDGDKLKGAVEALSGGADVIGVEVDLSTGDGAALLLHEAVTGFGGVDILVNNAGGGVIRPTLQHTEETLRATLDRNLWTVLHCTLAVLPHMVERGYGRIVNIGAESVRNGLYMHAVYNAAKGGVHGLTTGLAREFAENGITVNTVAPGSTKTPAVAALLSRLEGEVATSSQGSDGPTGTAGEMILGIPAAEILEVERRTVALIPMARHGTVEEIASAVTYLASDEASFVTGQVLSVNGGSSML